MVKENGSNNVIDVYFKDVKIIRGQSIGVIQRCIIFLECFGRDIPVAKTSSHTGSFQALHSFFTNQ